MLVVEASQRLRELVLDLVTWPAAFSLLEVPMDDLKSLNEFENESPAEQWFAYRGCSGWKLEGPGYDQGAVLAKTCASCLVWGGPDVLCRGGTCWCYRAREWGEYGRFQ